MGKREMLFLFHDSVTNDKPARETASIDNHGGRSFAGGGRSFRRAGAVGGYKGGFAAKIGRRRRANLLAVTLKADPYLWGSERAATRKRDERGMLVSTVQTRGVVDH